MNLWGIKNGKKFSDNGETLLCTVDEFAVTVYDNDDAVMTDRFYRMDGG